MKFIKVGTKYPQKKPKTEGSTVKAKQLHYGHLVNQITV